MSDPIRQSRTPTTETSPDLSSVIRNNISEGNLSLEVKEREDPADRAARLEILKTDAHFTRIRDVVLLLAGVLLSLVITGVCLWFVIDQRFSPEIKEWSRSIITLIIGTFVGFITGKATK